MTHDRDRPHRPTLVGLESPDGNGHAETDPPPRLRPVRTLDDEIPDRDRIDAILNESRDTRTWRRAVDEWRHKKDAQLDRFEAALLQIIAGCADILDQVKAAAKQAAAAEEDAEAASRLAERGSAAERKLVDVGLSFAAARVPVVVAGERDAVIEKRDGRQKLRALAYRVADRLAMGAAGAVVVILYILAKGCHP